MRFLMLRGEAERLACLFAGVAGQPRPESKSKERDPIQVKKGVATIKIKGPLYAKRDSWLDYWGEDYAVYSEIVSDIAEARFKDAKHIDFEINSPGGTVEGLYETMHAIASAGVPTRTIAGDMLASAAYMLASQTGEIVAESEVSTIGSVGIATWMYVSDRVVDVTNSDSPDKLPDVTTEAGKKVVEGELDDLYQIYAEMIASGRKTSIDAVKRDYGRGAVMTARTALKKKMIDGIMSNQPAQSKAAKIGDKMDAKTLREEHRATYDAVFEAGKEVGTKEEHERVCAHLILADGSGDVEAAHNAIQSGEGITEMVKALHMSAAMKRNMIAAREADNPPVVNTSGPVPEVSDLEEKKIKAEFEAAHPGWEVE